MCVQALQVQVVECAQLGDFFAEHLKEFYQLVADNLFGFRPGFWAALLAAKKKHGVAFQLGHFQRQLDLPDDGFDQFGDDGLAVAERLGVGGHVARVAADVCDDEQHRFGHGVGMRIHLCLSERLRFLTNFENR